MAGLHDSDFAGEVSLVPAGIALSGVSSGSSLLVPSDWQTRQKHPNKRTESLRRGPRAIGARALSRSRDRPLRGR
jgi:hypothetical protein